VTPPAWLDTAGRARPFLGTCLLAVLTLGTISCFASPPLQLTPDHRKAIDTALKQQGLPTPQSLEINDSRYLVATFELRGAVTAASLQDFAEKALLTIRNTMQPYRVVNAYRVTVNGPSPGPGLIRRYGSARFLEGGSLEWQPAK
jgi:hypothetical protein